MQRGILTPKLPPENSSILSSQIPKQAQLFSIRHGLDPPSSSFYTSSPPSLSSLYDEKSLLADCRLSLLRFDREQQNETEVEQKNNGTKRNPQSQSVSLFPTKK